MTMLIMKFLSRWFALITCESPLAITALQPRLGGVAVYDTDLNITWLATANLSHQWA